MIYKHNLISLKLLMKIVAKGSKDLSIGSRGTFPELTRTVLQFHLYVCLRYSEAVFSDRRMCWLYFHAWDWVQGQTHWESDPYCCQSQLTLVSMTCLIAHFIFSSPLGRRGGGAAEREFARDPSWASGMWGLHSTTELDFWPLLNFALRKYFYLFQLSIICVVMC